MTLKQFLGDSHTHAVPLAWQGSAFSPGGDWLLIFTLKANAEDPDTAAIIQKASGAGITVTGSTAAVSTVPQDTEDLDPADRLPWDIQAQHTTTGEVRTVAVGRMTLSRDLTRQTSTSVPVHTAEPPVPFLDVAQSIHAAGGSEDIHDDDEFGITKSQSAWALAKLKWSTIRAKLKTYFDNLYPSTTDPRLSDARPPTAHKASHLVGGSDALFRVLSEPARVVKSFSIPSAGTFEHSGVNYNDRPVYAGTGGQFLFGYDEMGKWSWRNADLSSLLELPEFGFASYPHFGVWMGEGVFGTPVFENVVWGSNVAGLVPGEIVFYGDQAWRCVSTDQTVNGTVWESISSVELAESRNNECFPPLEGSAYAGWSDHVVMLSGGKVGLIRWSLIEGWMTTWFEGVTYASGSKTWGGHQSFQGGITAKTRYENTTTPLTVAANDYSIVFYGTSGSGSVTLPLASANLGRILCIKNLAPAWSFLVNRTGSDTIDGGTSKSLAYNKGIIVQAIASGVWVILSQI